MSETITVSREAAPPGLVLVDLYKQLWDANQTIAESRHTMGESSVEDNVRKWAESALDRPINIDEISAEQLAGIGRSTLETFVNYSNAELELLGAQHQKSRIENSITDFISEHISKKVDIRTAKGASGAIALERLGISERHRASKYLMSGTGRLTRPYSPMSDQNTLELTPTGFTTNRLWGGMYYVKPIDAESGEPQVSLVVES